MTTQPFEITLATLPRWRDVCPVKVHASVNDELPPANAPRYA